MFGPRLLVSRVILPNATSLSCCCRFAKKGITPSGPVACKTVANLSYNRTYASSVESARETELHDHEVHEGNGKRKKKSRPSAAKTSLRRAALEAQFSQDEGSSSSLRSPEVTRESKVNIL